MAISVFDLFKIGIGPSSSHTVGPMLAAGRFVDQLASRGLLDAVARLQIELFGSLGATGKGHGSDRALMLGLMGETPATVEVDAIPRRLDAVRESGTLVLAQGQKLTFDAERDLKFHRRRQLDFHPNGMCFTAYDAAAESLHQARFYSVGGGFVVQENARGEPELVEDTTPLRYPFESATALLALCEEEGLSVSQLMLENEQAWRGEAEIRQRLLEIWRMTRQISSAVA